MLTDLSFVIDNKRHPSFWLIVRFGSIGIVATLVHAAVLMMGVERFGLAPSIATMIGFCAALNVSYFGHYYVTFRSSRSHIRAIPTFIVMAFAGAGANWLIFVVINTNLEKSYWLAFLIAIATIPIATFIISRTLVFHAPDSDK